MLATHRGSLRGKVATMTTDGAGYDCCQNEGQPWPLVTHDSLDLTPQHWFTRGARTAVGLVKDLRGMIPSEGVKGGEIQQVLKK